jgi:hypothetical protein
MVTENLNNLQTTSDLLNSARIASAVGRLERFFLTEIFEDRGFGFADKYLCQQRRLLAIDL